MKGWWCCIHILKWQSPSMAMSAWPSTNCKKRHLGGLTYFYIIQPSDLDLWSKTFILYNCRVHRGIIAEYGNESSTKHKSHKTPPKRLDQILQNTTWWPWPLTYDLHFVRVPCSSWDTCFDFVWLQKVYSFSGFCPEMKPKFCFVLILWPWPLT